MASQQQLPGGPTVQAGLQQTTSLQQQQHQLSQQQDFDPVHRFKMLIPQLKESLQVIVPKTSGRKTKQANFLITRYKWLSCRQGRALNTLHCFSFVECNEDRLLELGP